MGRLTTRSWCQPQPHSKFRKRACRQEPQRTQRPHAWPRRPQPPQLRRAQPWRRTRSWAPTEPRRRRPFALSFRLWSQPQHSRPRQHWLQTPRKPQLRSPHALQYAVFPASRFQCQRRRFRPQLFELSPRLVLQPASTLAKLGVFPAVPVELCRWWPTGSRVSGAPSRGRFLGLLFGRPGQRAELFCTNGLPARL